MENNQNIKRKFFHSSASMYRVNFKWRAMASKLKVFQYKLYYAFRLEKKFSSVFQISNGPLAMVSKTIVSNEEQ